VSLLRQKSIHPSYQTEEKQVTKPSTDDKATGKLREIKGTIKEKVGEIVNDPELEADGKEVKNASKSQNWAGKGEQLVGE